MKHYVKALAIVCIAIILFECIKLITRTDGNWGVVFGHLIALGLCDTYEKVDKEMSLRGRLLSAYEQLILTLPEGIHESEELLAAVDRMTEIRTEYKAAYPEMFLAKKDRRYPPGKIVHLFKDGAPIKRSDYKGGDQ